MKPIRNMISVDEALEIIMKNVKTIEESESVAIEMADKRVLAEDVRAQYNVPPFNRSAMDGYAIRSKDTKANKTFRIVGKMLAGESKNLIVGENECVEIATGAPLPESCDAVVMFEDCEILDGGIRIKRSVEPFENVSKVGEDIKKGEVLLERSTLIDPSRIGALAALGINRVKVLRKPKVGIISTGNEVVPLNKELERGKIYDINSYTLSALVERNFCECVTYGIIEDSREALEKALKSALSNDIIVFSGGSSAGEKDMLADIVDKDLLFHGVRVKPGKPTLFAVYEGKPLFGLPGFPTSCLMNGYILLVPALRKMAGAPERERRVVKARMAHDLRLSKGRRKNVTVSLNGDYAYSVYKESSTITSFVKATGFITVEEGKEVVEKGEEVEVELFSW